MALGLRSTPRGPSLRMRLTHARSHRQEHQQKCIYRGWPRRAISFPFVFHSLHILFEILQMSEVMVMLSGPRRRAEFGSSQIDKNGKERSAELTQRSMVVALLRMTK